MTLALSEHLPLIASAPGGIQKLRWLILELAVRGKLLPQEPSDEPATKLLERIEQEQKVLAKAGAYKKTKSIPQPATEGQPFDLPKSWAWTNFANVTSYIQRGKGPSYADKSDYVVVSQKCVRWNGLDLSQARCITPESFSKYDAIRLLRCGDVLWNSTGTGTIGRAVIVPNLSEDQLLVADSHVTVVRPIIISPDYLWRWIQTPTVQNTIESMASGSTNQIELATSTVTAHPIPIPPLAEQHRIVAKVDELMALCDRLESEQNDSAAAHTVLVETLLGTLTQSTDAADFEANWQRIAEHFDTLFTTEASIDALQKAILQLAVMGKLVPQGSRSAPGSGPLKKFSQGQPNPLLPSGWVYSTLGEAVEIIRGITFPSNEKSKSPMPGRVMCLRTSNVQNKIEWEDVLYIRNEFVSRDDQYLIENDVVMSMANSRELVGKVALIESLPNERATFGGFLGVLRPISVLPKFLMAFLRSPAVRSTLIGSASQTTNIANISLTKLRPLMLPIPPITEQHQIVAKIDELMAVCDQLKASIKAATAAQSTLSLALIQQTLEAA